jgi:hypothetical protein
MACSKVDVEGVNRAVSIKANKSAGVHDGWKFGEIPGFSVVMCAAASSALQVVGVGSNGRYHTPFVVRGQ